jgi:pyruvate,water dikinase
LERFGGKAVNLARLHRAGLKVPIGFSISSECFSEYLAGLEGSDGILQRLESPMDIEETMNCAANLERLGSSWKMPEETKKQIMDALMRLKSITHGHGIGYAIRSSANVEDSRHISFAGQAESFLCVNGTENVVDSVRRTWQSAVSFRSALYLHEMGVPLSKVRMGVIVQEMVAADVSGVMFTVNTVTKDPSQIIIESTWGLGEPLVSGKIVPDTFFLQRNPLKVVQRVLGSKATFAAVSVSEQQHKIVLQDTPPDKRTAFTLNDAELLNLARLGMKVENTLGGPQDIEWCIRDSQLIVLQARPVTTMQQSSH